MVISHNLLEQRQHIRYRAAAEPSFVLNLELEKIGRIENISRGGVLFHYADQERWPDHTAGSCTLFSENIFIDNISFKVIQDDVIVAGSHLYPRLIRQRRIKFGALKAKAEYQLIQLIKTHQLQYCRKKNLPGAGLSAA